MITKENGFRYAKLIHVSVDNKLTSNSNKVYIMEELSDGRIKCEYGRVGKGLAVTYKPKRKWDSVLKQKLSKTKGYTDVTELLAEPVIDDSKPIDNRVDSITSATVRKLVNDLMGYANQSIQRNYKVTQDAVSERQIEAAQTVIDEISPILDIGVDMKMINRKLLRLYTIIPRKMDNVKYHLFYDITNYNSLDDAKELLSSEQDTLDTMGGQVKLLKQQKEKVKTVETNTVKENLTILEVMGLSIEVEDDKKMINTIYKLLGRNESQAKGIYKVVNHKTQAIFDTHLKKAEVKKKRYYWHGSRNENYLNLLQTGMLIRPSCAVHTGSMFSDGAYFASKSSKSIGYTSLRGSYWSNGYDEKEYLALFDVHIGNQKHIYKHESSCYKLNYKNLQKEGFDSVFAHGGADLRNDEFIIYNTNQCTISHLIEITK